MVCGDWFFGVADTANEMSVSREMLERGRNMGLGGINGRGIKRWWSLGN